MQVSEDWDCQSLDWGLSGMFDLVVGNSWGLAMECKFLGDWKIGSIIGMGTLWGDGWLVNFWGLDC